MYIADQVRVGADYWLQLGWLLVLDDMYPPTGLLPQSNYALRALYPNGTLTTVTGGWGRGGADGPWTVAQLVGPQVSCAGTRSSTHHGMPHCRYFYGTSHEFSLAPAGTPKRLTLPNLCLQDPVVRGDGDLYVIDSYGQSIRKVSMPDRFVTRVAGITEDPGKPLCLLGSKASVCELMLLALRCLHHTGYIDGAALTAKMSFPSGGAFDAVGNLWFGSWENRAIRSLMMPAVVYPPPPPPNPPSPSPNPPPRPPPKPAPPPPPSPPPPSRGSLRSWHVLQ